MIFRSVSRGIFMIEIIHHPLRIVRKTASKHEKKSILRSLVDPVSLLVPFYYLDTRNILLNPTALPNKAASHTRCNRLVFMIGRMLDQHHAQDM
jgi:hypothetical protein